MSPAPRAQCAALPFRFREGKLEVLLITSRDTGRWVIPKGWPVPGLPAHEAAAREAYEEAGLQGRIGEQSIGQFHYDKRLADGACVACVVDVFALEFKRQSRSWPEQDQRKTRWFAFREAAEAVQEPELQALIQNLAALWHV